MTINVQSFETIKAVFDDMRWLEARRLIEELTEKDQTSSSGLSTEQDAILSKIIADVATIAIIDKAISSASSRKSTDSDKKDAWILSKDKHGVRVEYRSEKGKATKSFAVSLPMEASPLTICPLMFEADLLPNFMPKILGLEIVILEERGKFGRLLYQKVYLPPPFKNRYAVIECQAIDVTQERNGFLIVVRSEDPGNRTLPPSSKGAIMMDIHLAGLTMNVTGPESMFVCNVINVDLKLTMVPNSLFNFITRTIMWHATRSFQQKAKVFQADGLPHMYEERFQLNRERVYDDIAARINRVVTVSPLKIAKKK